MTSLKTFMQIAKLPGVDQYILVDRQGKIAAHDIKTPEQAATMVLTCGLNSEVIGRTRFEQIIISRQNQKNIFIFPVGKYYLGVVKQKQIDNIRLVNHIGKFLDRILNKKKGL